MVNDSMLVQNSFDQLLNQLRSEIAPEQMYVVGNKRLSKKICISSLLECTRDISYENCKNCLRIRRIRELQNYNQTDYLLRLAYLMTFYITKRHTSIS